MGNAAATPPTPKDEAESESLLAADENEEEPRSNLVAQAGEALSGMSRGLAHAVGIEKVKPPEEQTWTEQLEAEVWRPVTPNPLPRSQPCPWCFPPPQA